MKCTITIFVLISQIFTGQIDHIDPNTNEELVKHTVRHLIRGSTSLEAEMKIGLVDPSVSNEMIYYSCTSDVIIDARSILLDRPNGSEVYALIVDNVIWELKICHEHNGEIIDCGNEL